MALRVRLEENMASPTEPLIARFHENAGFLSCSLGPETTGVEGAVVWMFGGEPTRDESELGPRILVVGGETLTLEGLANAVAVRLSSPPEVVGMLPRRVAIQAVALVDANRELLRRYWQGEMATGDALDLLVRV